MDQNEIEAINRAEELLLRARSVARQIQQRVQAVLEKHGLSAPHDQERTPEPKGSQIDLRHTDEAAGEGMRFSPGSDPGAAGDQHRANG